jgi:hypothetical protein
MLSKKQDEDDEQEARGTVGQKLYNSRHCRERGGQVHSGRGPILAFSASSPPCKRDESHYNAVSAGPPHAHPVVAWVIDRERVFASCTAPSPFGLESLPPFHPLLPVSLERRDGWGTTKFAAPSDPPLDLRRAV